MGVEIGEPAPDFTLPGVQAHERRDYTLSEYRGHKVVLAFYPGDFTPGCTRQMCSYRDHFDDFAGVDATVADCFTPDVDEDASPEAVVDWVADVVGELDALAAKPTVWTPTWPQSSCCPHTDTAGTRTSRRSGRLRPSQRQPRPGATCVRIDSRTWAL